ncbi:NACHT domain-containing protein [Glycomyces endophyticus]|uniref:NACHT domain-containing protein n=1 Tax=Glycomyces endophyticus TaxID=480996 RepID=A0ABN2HJS4_9ACTN
MASPFGLLLRSHRLRRDMSQKRLEEESGVGIRTIRRYENSDQCNPQVETIRLLADALRLTRSEYAELLTAAGLREQSADRGSPRPDPPFHAELTAAADALAYRVRGQWKREEEQRQVHDPAPLPVRWRVEETLSDHGRNVFGAGSRGRHARLDLSGELKHIADMYAGVPTGRLVVVGRTGSGKTILAVRLVMDLLEHRRSGDPVPVIFNLSSWNPRADLRTWLASQLLRDHPALGNTLPDQTPLATALIENDLVLPVLDGFDEIARDLVRDPLEKLNRSTSMPLILTSRTDEYRKAVAESDVLTAAACVELSDLTPDDLAEYLLRTTRRTGDDGASIWEPVLEALQGDTRTEATESLAAAFTTPLMVSLARTIYNDAPGHDPAELLDVHRFRTVADVETHLLGNLIPTAYRHQDEHRRFDPERVRHWHGHLAAHLHRLRERDLAWWRLGTSMRRPARMAVMALVFGLPFTVVDVVVFAILMDYLPIQYVSAAAIDLTAGAAVGVAHGLLAKYRGAALEPSGMQVRFRGRPPGPPRNLLRRFRIGFAAGLLIGFCYGASRELLRGVVLGTEPVLVLQYMLFNALLIGLTIGFATGVTYMCIALWERPLDVRSVQSPDDLIRSTRRTVLVQAVLFSPALVVLIPLTLWTAVQLLGLLPPEAGTWTFSLSEGVGLGLYGGFIGAVGYALAMTAWGQWIVFGRLWLPLTGRLPWAVPEFLDDAYRRGVLRRSGVVYQFRHARLQDHLAATHRAAATRETPGGPGRT